MESTRIIADITSGIGTLIIAVIVAYIAWRQHCTSRDRLRLDLFDKRYQVYATLVNFLSYVASNPKPEANKIMEFKARTSDAAFLFDADLCQHITQVYENAWAARQTQQALCRADLKGYTDQHTLEKKEQALFSWFSNQMRMAQQKFEPYLKFSVKQEKLLRKP